MAADTLTAKQQDVLMLVQEHGPITVADLAKRAGRTSQTLQPQIAALQKKGRVIQEGLSKQSSKPIWVAVSEAAQAEAEEEKRKPIPTDDLAAVDKLVMEGKTEAKPDPKVKPKPKGNGGNGKTKAAPKPKAEARETVASSGRKPKEGDKVGHVKWPDGDIGTVEKQPAGADKTQPGRTLLRWDRGDRMTRPVWVNDRQLFYMEG